MKDYHQQALNKGYTGVMLFHKDKIDWIPQRYISVVMKPGDPSELVSQIGEIWNNYFADSSFDYSSSTSSMTGSTVRMRLSAY